MKNGNNNRPEEIESERILISFYLRTETLEELDDVLFYARKRLPMGKRRKLTKSALYEIGLKMVIEDYHNKGNDSFLMQSINELVKN